jgi:glycosyltransferase involved in cell wall biosynthesis
MNPRLSIVIPTYNRAQMLLESISSALPALDLGAEIIVVDDGSNDHTSNIALSFGSKIKYNHKVNQGKSTAINLVLEGLTSRYVLILDDDDLLEVETVHDFLQYLDDNLEIDYVFGQYKPFYKANGDIRYLDDVPANINHDRIFYDLLVSNFFSLNSMIFRRQCSATMGLFDTRLIRSQDYDFLLRIVQQCKGQYLPQVIFYCRIHQGRRGSSDIFVPADRVSELWNRFDGLIGEKIRANVELEHFIRDDLKLLPEPTKLRAALFQRAYVMATKHLVSEALSDLELAVASMQQIFNNLNALTDAEKESILGIFSAPAIKKALKKKENWRKICRLLSQKKARQIRHLIIKRLYWDFAISMRNHNYGNAINLLIQAFFIQKEAVTYKYPNRIKSGE